MRQAGEWTMVLWTGGYGLPCFSAWTSEKLRLPFQNHRIHILLIPSPDVHPLLRAYLPGAYVNHAELCAWLYFSPSPERASARYSLPPFCSVNIRTRALSQRLIN
ncbi:hypothetical protein SEVIR_1G141500v4 [Setaria viridis]|uniref:Uncharacterized protein n=1 Tax=Setaria viridis TaxID=4556 RepID=A0A4U6W831_SETVI|nr:hypothetical protein SEVIR_1G141500v2 [Setaria viridis]